MFNPSYSSSIVPRSALSQHQISAPEVRVLPGLSDILPKEDEDKPAPSRLSAEDARLAARIQEAKGELADLQEQLEKARADIEQAQKDADYIRQQALTDAQGVRDKARMEGYTAGAEEARSEYDKVLERESRDFARSVQTLASAKHEIAEQLEPAVLDLSLHCAEKIVHQALERDDSIFMNIVRDTIKEVEDAEEIVLRVNKKEYDRFFADPHDDYTRLLEGSGVKIRQDMSVESGECVVETEFGTLRSGVQTQLERMRTALEGA